MRSWGGYHPIRLGQKQRHYGDYMIWDWLKRLLFRRRKHSIQDPHTMNAVALKRWDDTEPPPKEPIQTQLPLKDERQQSLEEWVGEWE